MRCQYRCRLRTVLLIALSSWNWRVLSRYITVEAGASSDPDLSLKYCTAGITLHTLQRAKQIVSKIVVGMRPSVLSLVKNISEISNGDKLKAAHIEVWKNYRQFSAVGFYKPSNSVHDFSIMANSITRNCVIKRSDVPPFRGSLLKAGPCRVHTCLYGRTPSFSGCGHLVLRLLIKGKNGGLITSFFISTTPSLSNKNVTNNSKICIRLHPPGQVKTHW